MIKRLRRSYNEESSYFDCLVRLALLVNGFLYPIFSDPLLYFCEKLRFHPPYETMSSKPTAYEQRRDLFMNSNIRSKLKEEIICTYPHLPFPVPLPLPTSHITLTSPSSASSMHNRQPPNRPSTNFNVVVKRPRDTNGKHMNAWQAILICYKNDNEDGFWVYEAGTVTHATQEEVLGYVLEKLQEGGFRGKGVSSCGGDHKKEEIAGHMGREEGGEQR